MASLLLGKSRKEWIEVCNSPGFFQDKDNRHMENTMHILSLSYYDLPSHLKTCLLYFSVFPEDTLIGKVSLIWKWIAEGFVEKKAGRESFEVGEEYFHDLINRSMIQGVDSEVYGIMDGCRIHDMVLDLIISMSREENFVRVDGSLAQSRTRRLALKYKKLDLTQDSGVNLPQVRSFIGLHCRIDKWASHPRLKLIRVVVLVDCFFGDECHSLQHIGDLHHLRYFEIQDLWCDEELLEAIGALKFLQTLNLLSAAMKLPCSIARLTQLVCLRVRWTSVSAGIIGKLTSLEQLHIFDDTNNDVLVSQRFEFMELFAKDLGNLHELRVLSIDLILIMDERMQIDLVQSLGNLKKMQHLKLLPRIDTVDMDVWHAAVPSSDLGSLFLPQIWFQKLPSWINYAHLPSLSHLEIDVHDLDDQGLIALGGLPELCYLSLHTCSRATITSNNNTEAGGCFQKLKSLVLDRSMVQLEGNEDSTAGSFTLGMAASGQSRNEDNSRVVVPTFVVMPSLEELQFEVQLSGLSWNKDASCGNLGLEYLPSIRKVKVEFSCYDAYEDDLEREDAALRHAIQVHPNCPALQIEYRGEETIKRRSDDDASATEEDADSNCTRSDHDDDPADPWTEEDEVASVLD